MKTVPLTQLSRELAALTGKPGPSYRKLYLQILDGRLPAVQINGRYEIDLDVAAEVLGLTEPAAA
jgi:hypothetical protein